MGKPDAVINLLKLKSRTDSTYGAVIAERDLRAVLDYVAELEGAHETLLNTALAFCHSIETKLKHGRASQKEVALEKAVAAALTGGEKGGG